MEEVREFLDQLPVRVKVNPYDYPTLLRFETKEEFAKSYSGFRNEDYNADFEQIRGAYLSDSKVVLLNCERIAEKGDLSEKLVLYHELGHWLDMSVEASNLFEYLRKEFSEYAEQKLEEHMAIAKELNFPLLSRLLAPMIERPAYLVEGYFVNRI